MNGIDLGLGRDNHIGGPVTKFSSQFYDCSEPGDSENAARLPSMDKRKPLVDDTKDLSMASDSNQQLLLKQQQGQQHQPLFNSTSSSCFFGDTVTELNLVQSQQLRHVKKSFEASLSACPHGHRSKQGIRAARQRFLLNKAAKQREVEAVPEALNRECQANETSCKSSNTLDNHSGAMYSFSNMRSNSEMSAQQMAVPRSVVLPPSQFLNARNPTPFTTKTDGGYSQSSSHGRLLQHSRPQLSSRNTYHSSAITGHNHRDQDNWATGEYLFIKVSNLPDHVTTHDLWGAFNHEGHIAHIRLHETAKGYRDGGASIKFRCVSEFCPSTSHYDN